MGSSPGFGWAGKPLKFFSVKRYSIALNSRLIALKNWIYIKNCGLRPGLITNTKNFNIMIDHLMSIAYIGSNECACVKLITCLLHSDKLLAIKLPYVEMTVRSTFLESMLLLSKVSFPHLKKFCSIWSPNNLAPIKIWKQQY